jgi:hypothetical protein
LFVLAGGHPAPGLAASAYDVPALAEPALSDIPVMAVRLVWSTHGGRAPGTMTPSSIARMATGPTGSKGALKNSSMEWGTILG